MLVLMEICSSPGVEGATGLPGVRGAGPDLAVPPVAGNRGGMQGCQAHRALPGESSSCVSRVKGKLVLCKLKYRDQNSQGGLWTEVMRSPAFIYSFSS